MKTMILVALVLAITFASCAAVSRDATPQEKIDEARAYIALAKEIGPALVEKGKIKQSELDTAVQILETAVDLYEASLKEDDLERRAALRQELSTALVKIVALLA